LEPESRVQDNNNIPHNSDDDAHELLAQTFTVHLPFLMPGQHCQVTLL